MDGPFHGQKPHVHLLHPHYPRRWSGHRVRGHSPGGESDRGAPVPTKRRHLEEPSASPVQGGGPGAESSVSFFFLFCRWSKGQRYPLSQRKSNFARGELNLDLPSSTPFSRRRWQSGTPLSCARRLLFSWQRMQSSRSLQSR